MGSTTGREPLSSAVLKAVRREKIEIKDMFSVFERNYWNAVIAGLIKFLIIGLGICMLIVPGIIFACRLRSKADSSPSMTSRLRTRSTVAIPLPTASATSSSLIAGPSGP